MRSFEVEVTSPPRPKPATPLAADLERARSSSEVREQTFRLLVESVRDYAIFMLDPKGLVASWNPGAQRIKQYRAEEIIGSHFSRFYPEEDVKAGKCQMELEGAAAEGRFEDEGWRVRKDGSRFWANVVITAVRDPSGTLVGFAKVTRDLTERKQAEEERIRLAIEQKAREAAEASNRAKDDFLAHVSHELRTPLNAILGWSRLLVTGLDAERSRRATETVQRNAAVMVKLIDDLLDVSRMMGGRMRLDAVAVDLALLIERAIDSVRLAAEAKGVALASHLDSHSPVLGDAERLQQVIWNLLTNAVKFTPSGGQITVTLRSTTESVMIDVADTGRGMSSSSLAHIFDAFWQEHRGPVAGGRGLGLGLAIARNIVALHGGKIEASSEGEQKGSTFTVTLPIGEPASRSEGPREAPDDSPLTASFAGIRVLVVEDDEDTRELVCEVLRKAGCAVTAAANVSDAMAEFTAAPPDILLSDIGLPGEDGHDLIRKVRALPAERGGRVPAAAITAYTRAEDRWKALGAGYMLHVPKPVDPNELVMVVSALSLHVARALE